MAVVTRTVCLLSLVLGGLCSLSQPAEAQSSPYVRRELGRLVKQLDHKREHKRLQAIEKLGELGKEARSTLPKLIAVLTDGNPVAKVTAARAVSRIAPDDKRVYRLLSELLTNTENHYQLRKSAALGLYRVASQIEPSRTEIIKLMGTELSAQKHGNLVDVALADSLGKMGTHAFSAGPALERALLKSPFEDVKAASFVAMARVSRPDDTARMPKLIADLRTGSLASKARAFGVLRARGKKAVPALDALYESAAPKHPVYEQVAALDTLAAVSPATAKSIALFVSAISVDHYLLRPAGQKALGALGRVHAESASAPLLEQLAKTQGEAKREVLRTLARVAPRAKATVAALTKVLEGLTAKDPELVVYEALEALRRGAPLSNSAGPLLLKLVDPSHALYQGRQEVTVDFLIGHVLVTLTDVGLPEGAAPVILKELQRDKPYVRPAVIRAVGALGEAGAPAVAQLVTLLKEEKVWTPILPFLHDSFPTVEAIRALGRIGPAAKAAIVVLNRLAERQADTISEIGVLEAQAARKALSRIQG
jgi:hypothetical protein